MISRRGFVGASVAAGMASFPLPTFRRAALAIAREANAYAAASSASMLADDETYWREIQRAFAVDRSLIYLNSAGLSPTPTRVLDEMVRELRRSNEAPVIPTSRQDRERAVLGATLPGHDDADGLIDYSAGSERRTQLLDQRRVRGQPYRQ